MPSSSKCRSVLDLKVSLGPKGPQEDAPHSGSKAQDNRDSRNHMAGRILICYV